MTREQLRRDLERALRRGEDLVRKELEEVLEKRENRSREVKREDVRTMLREWSKEMDGTRDQGGQGRQALEKEKESGTDKVGKRRAEPVRGRDEERPAVRGNVEFPPLRVHVVVRGGAWEVVL